MCSMNVFMWVVHIICAGTHAYACMQKAEIRVRCLSLLLSILFFCFLGFFFLFLRQALPLNPEITNSAKLARDPFISDSPGLVPQCVPQLLALLCGYWGPKPQLCAYMYGETFTQ